MTDTKTIAFDADEIKAGIEKALHATIGAGVVAGRKVAAYDFKGRLEAMKGVDYKAKADELGTKTRDELTTAYGEWAKVGAETVADLRTKVDVDDLTHKVGERVNVDQWQEQAGKLRGQLEDLVSNWRTNFAPEGEVTETVVVEIDEEKDDLTEINGVGPTYASRLAEAGILTYADLAKADVAKVAEVAKVSEAAATGWIAEAKK